MSSGSPEEHFHRPTMPKGSQAWEDVNSMSRSPLGIDQAPQAGMSKRQRGASSFGFEPSTRASNGPTLSNLPSSRNFSGRQATERGISLTVNQHRSPYPSSSRFFLTVVPPFDLPHNPPHPRSQASTSSSAHLRRGTLLPLYPTLGGQLYAISREYGLPSIGGLSIYLCDDGVGNLGPRVGDVAWSALWSRYFDENADDLFQDITSPPVALPTSFNHERDHSRTSSDLRSPYGDQMGIRRESEGYEEEFGGSGGYQHEELRRPSSSMRRPLVNGLPGTSMAYNTPSPRGANKWGRSQSRSSFHTPPVSVQARLPIVGRIEWAVDKNRAPWWSNWIGETEASSEKSTGSMMTSQAIGSGRRGPARRSMHLTSSLSRSRPESPDPKVPLKATVLPSPQTQQAPESNAVGKVEEVSTFSGSEDQEGTRSIPPESIIDMSNLGYEPIEDQETHEIATEDGQHLNMNLNITGVKSLPHSDDVNNVSYENRSYAGYSALLGADDETREGASMRGLEDEHSSNRASPIKTTASRAVKIVEGEVPGFNPDILMDNDEDHWRHIHQGMAERDEREHDNDYISRTSRERLFAQTLSVQEEKHNTPIIGERGPSAVHEWISKTQSPQVRQEPVDYEQEAEEEILMPPQDDVGDVIGLWAEKTREVDLMSKDASSQRTSIPRSLASPENSKGQQSDKGTSRRSSHHQVSPVLTTQSPRVRQSPLPGGSARLPNLLEDLPLPKEETSASINKASLLSPIALDNSPSTFAGPSASLATLMGTRNTLSAPNAGPSLDFTSKQQNSPLLAEAELPSRLISIDLMRKPPNHSDSMNSLSSPRLELPSPRSPGGISQRSSSTEASDTLLDMERALALLSPAISHQNNGSPAMVAGPSTTDTTYDYGNSSFLGRGRAPFVSSRDSMAKAKTLSTSVTPSPRWFRNTTANLPHFPLSASANLNASRTASGATSMDSQNDSEKVKVSPRPASAYAGTKSQDRTAPWDLQPPASSSRLVANVNGGKKPQEEEEKKHVINRDDNATPVPDVSSNSTVLKSLPPSPEIEADLQGKRESHASTPASEVFEEGGESALTHEEGPSDLELKNDNGYSHDEVSQSQRSAADKGLVKESLSFRGRSSPVQIFDSPLEADSSQDVWLQPNENLGRQGWSQTTSGDSSRRTASRGDAQGIDVLQQSGFDRDLKVAASPFASSDLPSTFSPRSGDYATVGVQAEREDGNSRTDSVISLVSDDEADSDHSQSNKVREQEDEGKGKEAEEEGKESDGEKTAQGDGAITPLGVAKTAPSTTSVIRATESSDDNQPSFQRMIRGFSFAESSEASSSQAVSPFLPENAEADDVQQNKYIWSNLNIGKGEQEDQHDDKDLEDDHLEKQRRGILDREQTESHLADDATTTRGGGEAATNVTSSQSDRDEEWSQDGSEYDDDEEEGDSPSTRRSRLSGYSMPLSAGLSDAGGRTPTFLYDHHLAEDEPSSRRSSKRLSSNNRRGSKQQGTSHRISRRSLRASDAGLQDVLGVGLSPGRQATISGFGSSNTGDESVGHLSNDAQSLAGEMLNSNDDRMLYGFEQVAHNPDDMNEDNAFSIKRERESTFSTASSNHSEKLKLLSEFTANANKREVSSPMITTTTTTSTITSVSPTPSSQTSYPASNSGAAAATVAGTKGLRASIRRSMGSITENRRNSTGKGRRASTSATSSPSKNVNIASPSPRRSNPNRMQSDGSAIPIRNALSPSPKQRFRALPPSPSFLAINPSSPKFGGHIPSPTTANFTLKRPSNFNINVDGINGSNGYFEMTKEGSPSPVFRGQSGTPTPPSPRGPRTMESNQSLSDFA